MSKVFLCFVNVVFAGACGNRETLNMKENLVEDEIIQHQ